MPCFTWNSRIDHGVVSDWSCHVDIALAVFSPSVTFRHKLLPHGRYRQRKALNTMRHLTQFQEQRRIQVTVYHSATLRRLGECPVGALEWREGQVIISTIVILRRSLRDSLSKSFKLRRLHCLLSWTTYFVLRVMKLCFGSAAKSRYHLMMSELWPRRRTLLRVNILCFVRPQFV